MHSEANPKGAMASRFEIGAALAPRGSEVSWGGQIARFEGRRCHKGISRIPNWKEEA